MDDKHVTHPSMEIKPYIPASSKQSLESFSTEELQEKLERRKQERTTLPLPLENPNYNNLRKVCQKYIKVYAKYGETPPEYHPYSRQFHTLIIDEALQAIYGHQIFQWLMNNR